MCNVKHRICLVVFISLSLTPVVTDFFRFRKVDPKQVLVPVPDELICKPRPRNDNFVRSSFRRSFKLVLNLLIIIIIVQYPLSNILNRDANC